jgi:hypothetical protein
VLGLLLLGLVLRLAGAAAHWQWFDVQHPSVWEKSKLELSQDANQYIQQADPDTWASPLHRPWAEQTYFRPPLASFYFVGLFRTVNFDRMKAAGVQALLAAIAYFFLFVSVQRIFGRTIGLVTRCSCFPPRCTWFCGRATGGSDAGYYLEPRQG